jgi:hypothetical protein
LTEFGVEILTLSGNATIVPFTEIKCVFFVREFGAEDPTGGRRAFLSRPKLDGVWVRFAFRDRDTLEGVMPNNLLQVEPAGFQCLPPHGAQRVFVPRAALIGVQVLGVVGGPLRSKKKKPGAAGQINLFEETA